MVIELVVYLVTFEAGAEGGGNGSRDSEALVAVVEDVKEGKAGIFVNGACGGGVDEVPGGAYVRIGDVKAVVEILKSADCLSGFVSLLLAPIQKSLSN